MISHSFAYRSSQRDGLLLALAFSIHQDLAIERGWLVLHESGTFVKFPEGEADMLRPEVAGTLAPTI